MCAIGDIIRVDKYITEDGKDMGRHSFIVIEDEKGSIMGMEYDFVGQVMSSIHDEEQKRKKLSYKENMLITSVDRVVATDNGREAYIKADQLYYFDKSKISYILMGTATQDILEKLYELLADLDKDGVIKVNIKNLTVNN